MCTCLKSSGVFFFFIDMLFTNVCLHWQAIWLRQPPMLIATYHHHHHHHVNTSTRTTNGDLRRRCILSLWWLPTLGTTNEERGSRRREGAWTLDATCLDSQAPFFWYVFFLSTKCLLIELPGWRRTAMIIPDSRDKCISSPRLDDSVSRRVY
jgi:hypothetical protein